MTEQRPLYELYADTEAATQAMRNEQAQLKLLLSQERIKVLEAALAEAKRERDALLQGSKDGRR